MTDDQMDDRLRRAGAAWRADEVSPAAAPAADEIDEVHAVAPARRSRTHRVLALASAAVVAAGLVAGGVFVRHLTQDRSSDTAPVALQGTVWQFRGDGSQDNAHSSATFYIGGSGRLVADDTCEVIGGSADITSATITVTKQIVRYRSCTDSVGETTFTRGLSLLRGRSTYSLDGEHLTITRAGATPMHFDAAPGTPPPILDVPTLVGANWRLVSVKDSSGTTSVSRDIRFHLADDGRYSASDGCNALSGAATVAGSRVDFGASGTTYALCTKGLSHAIGSILRGQVTQLVDRSTMTLTKKGVGTLTYRWVPQHSPATAPASLIGTDWQLSQAAGAASTGDASLYIDSTGKLTGSDGCRQLLAHAGVQAGAMTIAGVPTARAKGCKDADQASTVDSFLTGDVLWSVRDGKLVINGGGAQAFALVYVKPGSTSSSTTDPKALKNTTWQLLATATGTGPLQPVASSIKARLGFVNNGKIDFDDTVNQNEGSVTIGSGTLRINSLMSAATITTAQGCRGTCEPSGVINAVLLHEPSWIIDGDKLTFSKSGVGILVYISTNSRKAASAAPPSSTNRATSAADLQGTTWRLTEIDHTRGNRGSGQSVVAVVNVDFAAQDVVVEETCSKITYATRTTNATIDFGRVLHRDVIPCPRQNAGVAQDVNTANAVLRGGVRWQLAGGRLTLTNGGTSLVFSS